MSSGTLTSLVFKTYNAMLLAVSSDNASIEMFHKSIPQSMRGEDTLVLLGWCVEKWLFERIYELVFAPKPSDLHHDKDLHDKLSSLYFIEAHHLNLPDDISKSSQWTQSISCKLTVNLLASKLLTCFSAIIKH